MTANSFPRFLFLVLLMLVLLDVPAFTQVPSWIDFDQRKAKYPDDEYFTGFGQAKMVKGENHEDNLQAAISYAKQDLAESVKVTVESYSVHELKETNEEFRESYKQAVNSFSDITLPGIQEQNWYDKKKKTAYAFAWVQKDKLANYFRELLDQDAKKLKVQLEKANHLNTIGEKQEALETYQTCFPVLRRMEESITMLLTIGVKPDGRMPSSWEQEISRAISGISNNENLSLDAFCQLATGTMMHQLEGNGGDLSEIPTIRFFPFTWEDTKMASQLSARMSAMLEADFVQEGIRVSSSGFENKISPLVLRGTLWDEGDFLKIMITIRNLKSGEIKAGSEGKISKAVLKASGLQWEPENLTDALVRKELLDKDQVVGGGLLLEVWTNKGDESLVFEEGETMTLSVRVNHPCHLRFVYYLNDGTKTLLMPGDYYIDQSKVNKLVELPVSFECAPPFGVDMLQVIAQTKPLPPLSLTVEDGYAIINEPDKELIKNLRGFKRRNNEELFAEKKLIITTLP
jgi:hypothetical protein